MFSNKEWKVSRWWAYLCRRFACHIRSLEPFLQGSENIAKTKPALTNQSFVACRHAETLLQYHYKHQSEPICLRTFYQKIDETTFINFHGRNKNLAEEAHLKPAKLDLVVGKATAFHWFKKILKRRVRS